MRANRGGTDPNPGTTSGGGLGDILGGGPAGGGLGGMIGSGLDSLSGALNDLVKGFSDKGHGDPARSWVNTGPNREASMAAIEDSLGPDALTDRAAGGPSPGDQPGYQTFRWSSAARR